MDINIFDLLNIFLILYIITFVFKNNDSLSNFTKVGRRKRVKVNNNNKKRYEEDNRHIQRKIIHNRLYNRAQSVLNDKLVPPEQNHESHNYVKVDNIMKINEHTRGEPENYQIVGLLYKEGVDKKYHLFGRRVYPGSPDWEYYIGGKDSGGLDYKYPLDTKQEIYDGTTIVNPIDGDTHNVKIYNYDKPRYIPYIV